MSQGSSSRSVAYRPHEDILLCKSFMHVSQDPAVGNNQNDNNFWNRIVDEYNTSREPGWERRTKKSLQGRWQLIKRSSKKFNSCVKQIERMNPSGASELDILNRAKTLMMEDSSYKSGYKFDHVWDAIKDFKFMDDEPIPKQLQKRQNSSFMSSDSDNQTPETQVPKSPELPFGGINLNTSDVSGSSSERPIGVKKAKLKRKMDDKYSTQLSGIRDDNKNLFDAMKKASDDRQALLEAQRVKIELQQKKMEMQQKKMDLEKQKFEWQIMSEDVNQIVDPARRAFVAAHQERIIRELNQQSQSGSSMPKNYFDVDFSNLGGGGSDLGDY